MTTELTDKIHPSDTLYGEEWAAEEELAILDEFADEVGISRAAMASQWQLMWWRFRKHRVAVLSVFVIFAFYLVGAFCEFMAINEPSEQYAPIAFMHPQRIHFDGVRPFVYAIKGARNPETLAKEYVEDPEVKYYIKFFAQGFDYTLWGLFPSNRHLLGLEAEVPEGEPIPFYPFGTDRMGRDMWSRIMYGTRISLSLGLVGVLISLLLGILLGGISGYRGGMTDNMIQRLIEFLRSMPTIPLWLALSAAVPMEWSVIQVYFAITIILSLIGWTGLAREVRGRFLTLREEDFITAAHLYGSSELRIIIRQMLPSFTSHIIAATTLAIPSMILAETALSFLGLGLRAPAISWGILLFEAQNLQAVAGAPWLLIPGGFVILAILAFNFFGDGLRDAADPYSV
jgi:peptide/nickel transport system permease protein